MKNLVIGDTSQLSHFFPENFQKVSSRNLDFGLLEKNKWDQVYLCFGESRKFLENSNSYEEINYNLTKELIELLNHNSNKIISYSTCELWNKYSGQISLSQPFDFYLTPYLESKYKITKFILSNKKLKNTLIMFPFNFNSIYRTENFLFGKIFDSIINKKEILIGDTYFYRDIIHPKFVVEESIKHNEHKIVGSGRLTFVNDFIRDLYSKFNLSYNDYVKEKTDQYVEYDKRNEYYLKSNKCLYSYNELLDDTKKDIIEYGGTN
jgi:nucleoside-diphosphate-sugar epimerase